MQVMWLGLGVGRTGDVEEEGQFIVGLVAAHVAGERVLVTMVTHVHRIHDHIFEGDVAIGALICSAPGTFFHFGRLQFILLFQRMRRWRWRSSRLTQRRRLALDSARRCWSHDATAFQFEGLALPSVLVRNGAVVFVAAEIQRFQWTLHLRRCRKRRQRLCQSCASHSRSQ